MNGDASINDPGHGIILWLTGPPCAGKTTLARALAARLCPQGPVEILDGDEVRQELGGDLGYSRRDRFLNVQRIGYLARRLARHGVTVLAAVVSPHADARDHVRGLAEREGILFLEIHIDAPLPILVHRDVKGLYRKALAGEIRGFTGIDDGYEAPTRPAARIDTEVSGLEESVQLLVDLLARHGPRERAAWPALRASGG
jgi:adenylyl-sulfate kinase